MYPQECWTLPVLDSLESSSLLAGNTGPGNYVPVITVGTEGSIYPALRIQQSIPAPCQPRVDAISTGRAPGSTRSHGLGKLSCPNRQPNFIRVPSLVLVPRLQRHGQLPGSPEGPSRSRERRANHGGLCIDPGSSLWFFFASGLILGSKVKKLVE